MVTEVSNVTQASVSFDYSAYNLSRRTTPMPIVPISSTIFYIQKYKLRQIGLQHFISRISSIAQVCSVAPQGHVEVTMVPV